MRRAYAPDLDSGRFVVLADFNTPGQERLFRVTDAAGRQDALEQPALSTRISRQATGAGGLHVVLAVGAVLWFDGVRSRELALLRNWQPYALLLASVYGPAEGATLWLEIRSGRDQPLHWRRRVHVGPGWNLLRIDLAEVAEAIDLGDVRAVRLWSAEADKPVELVFDDWILTDNTRWLVPRAGQAQLYAFSRGRRLHVGSPGRFELAFADGVIAAWVGVDPARVNHTVASGLGPWPVPLEPGWFEPDRSPPRYDDPQRYAAWGSRIEAGQRLLEATATRAVVRGVWTWLSPDGPRPTNTWTWTLWPDGRAYVLIETDPAGAALPASLLGYAVALNGRLEFTRADVRSRAEAASGSAGILLSRNGSQRSDLLWAPHEPALLRHVQEIASADGRRMAVVVGALAGQGDKQGAGRRDGDQGTRGIRRGATAHMLRFWPADLDAPADAEAFVADYQHPATIRVRQGRLVTATFGDLDHDGFNESQGVYELAADGAIVRFTFDPAGLLRPQPIFRIAGTADRRAWVYVNGRVLEVESRDRFGHLLIRLDQVVTEPLSIEVTISP